ncbi:hypothetical protein HBI56_214450 [Parastagonospora nodorum]|uniref:Uncharacterized protein n=2 Tax=Phaeosphaeria nodorum (strain SN15 / ATCC MYA-4574 / FGSC 10173) TaxID=321614 RepID=A0A7U2FAE2_PHANO|nr:hypothetical protein SNOG_14328 [Parastagonospora nodorum SN15]KAH3904650.1 hypothetical protein HBH56_230410 [Parastagonospora nodorum]EAT78199.1 hypothetical protein SNOG_14328 [Parastagonospora nodorum SN15]KAH3924461.1 hypothetical protein HBH54_194760 [Parastagonospora nodorum]KAH3940149.1 hypothetical protein HBH53_222350 [Parastagonospora nodorum]KAH3958421.1 hypothetical protein HBH51_210130 [Parastagonospora nodorum]
MIGHYHRQTMLANPCSRSSSALAAPPQSAPPIMVSASSMPYPEGRAHVRHLQP